MFCFFAYPRAARREPWSSDVLGHQEPLTEIRDHGGMGRLVRQRLLQGQPQPAVQHERVRGADQAEGPDAGRGRGARGRRLEAAERLDERDDCAGIVEPDVSCDGSSRGDWLGSRCFCFLYRGVCVYCSSRGKKFFQWNYSRFFLLSAPFSRADGRARSRLTSTPSSP